MASGKSLGDESATDADAALRSLLFPDGSQIDANRRKNRNMQNGKEILGKFFSGIQFDGDTAEAKVEYAGAPGALVAKDRVGVGSGHGNALGLALDGKNFRRRRSKLTREGNRRWGRGGCNRCIGLFGSTP